MMSTVKPTDQVPTEIKEQQQEQTSTGKVIHYPPPPRPFTPGSIYTDYPPHHHKDRATKTQS